MQDQLSSLKVTKWEWGDWPLFQIPPNCSMLSCHCPHPPYRILYRFSRKDSFLENFKLPGCTLGAGMGRQVDDPVVLKI